MSKPVTIIVAALLPDFGIGYKNSLPWRLPQELKYFRKVTIGDETHSNAVVMGRKTWESIPPKFRPLPNRLNVVITRNKDHKPQGKELIFNSVNEALESLQSSSNIKHIYIIGGQEIYRETLPLVNNLLITEVNSNEEIPIDTYLDKQYIQTNFIKQKSSELSNFIKFEQQFIHNENNFDYEFCLYTRK